MFNVYLNDSFGILLLTWYQMILGLEGEKSVEFFLVPAVAFHHVQFPHASACEHNQHIVTGEDGKLRATQVDVLVPIVSLVTY